MAERPLVDVRPDLWRIVQDILQKQVPQYEVWAFGSRAKWTAKEFSDLDLTVISKEPLTFDVSAALAEAFSESDLPWKVDVVDWASTSAAFRQIIERDRVVVQSSPVGRVSPTGVTRQVPDEPAAVGAEDVGLRCANPTYEGEWKTVPIETLCLGIYDGPHATPKKIESGPIFLGISSLNNGQLDLSNTEHLSEEDFAKWTRRVTPKAGDIVFSYETRLGQVAVIPPGLRCCLGRRMALMRVDPAKAIPDYLLYAYLSPDFQDVIRQRTIHGSTVDRIPLVEFGSFPIAVPPLAVQHEVVAVLRALDDRITLLRETNATLEAIAQALFKSWFVDFDPVRAKLEGRAPEGMDEATAALFPNALEESELGWVPKGWRMSHLADLTSAHHGSIQTGPFGSQLHASDYVDSGVPVVMPKDIKDRRVMTDSVARVTQKDADRLSRHKLMAGDIVFSRRGDVERHALITEREAGWLCGTGCLLLRPGESWRSSTFLSMALDAIQARTWLVQHAVGATMPNINTGILGSVPVLLPPDDLLSAFEDVVSATELQRSHNSSTAETLATLRDTLLPRLISGQLRLPEAQALVAAA